MNSRRHAVIAAFSMACAVVGAHLLRPTKHLVDVRAQLKLEDVFPAHFADWTLDNVAPPQIISPDQAALMAKIYSETLNRTYIDRRGQRVMLSVAYGGDQSDATRAHRPDVCYPAQGFSLLDSKDRELELAGIRLRTRQLVARQGSRNEPVTYWIIVGEKPILGGPEQKYAQLSYTARGIIPDGMLVRVSNIDNNNSASFELHRRFLEDMLLAMTEAARRRVIGRLAAGIHATPNASETS